jgi:hypothetical protein
VSVVAQQHSYTMRGTCPHCHKGSGFLPRGTAYVEHIHPNKWIVPMQCQTCCKYIMAIAQQPHPNNPNYLVYDTHYPVGEPDDEVAAEIPPHIQPDFREALRCRFVDAYNATAEMCRRALEASCMDLGASPKDVLEDMIDELETKRVITPFLKEVAHKIRLGGNRGAHPSPQAAVPPAVDGGVELPPAPGPITTIIKEHADAIIKFTREFFHHVYVVPRELNKYDFSKPKAPRP